MLEVCETIARRCREARTGAVDSFAIPEAADAAAWAARRTADPATLAEAEGWQRSGASYHALLRLCSRAVLSVDASYAPFEARYSRKVEGELESMLALCPDVIALPTTASLSARDMIRLRAYPIHPLGLVDDMTWTDGALAPPSEFFFHDLDHARFKIREDLLVEGIEIPDAYRSGSTVDPGTGRHRQILPFARGLIGDRLWARVPTRVVRAERLMARVDALPDSVHRAAAELLLFEIIHEKSFPLEAAILRRELANEMHVAKLHRKADARFFPDGISTEVIDALSSVRFVLNEALD